LVPHQFQATIKVYNGAGELVAVLESGLGLSSQVLSLAVLQGVFVPDTNGLGTIRLNGPDTVISWDGSTNTGQKVQSGSYNVVVSITDPMGNVETFNQPLTVIRVDTGVTVEVFNSAGELVWSEHKNSGSAGAIGLSTRELVPDPAGPGLKIVYGAGAGDSVTWNGLNSQGQAVASGTYLVQVTQSSPTGKNTFSQSVSVIQAPGGVFASAAAGPNPARAGVASVFVQFYGVAGGTQLWGDVYNLAGERIGALSSDPGGLRWDLPKGLASGIFILRLNGRSPSGQAKSQSLKVAVVR
jgi:hypothetical protein